MRDDSESCKPAGVFADNLRHGLIAPSIINAVGGYAPAGSNKQDAEFVNGAHLLTPETETTCHYFAALSGSFRLDEPELDGADFMTLHNLVLSTDKGALMARRLLRRLMAREAATLTQPHEKQNV
jgi:hypothetical protein